MSVGLEGGTLVGSGWGTLAPATLWSSSSRDRPQEPRAFAASVLGILPKNGAAGRAASLLLSDIFLWPPSPRWHFLGLSL